MTIVKKISDFVVKNSIILLICIAITHFYIRNFTISILVATTATFIISLLLKINSNSKQKKITLSKKNEQTLKDLFFTLTLNPTPKNILLLKKALSDNYKTELQDGALILNKEIYAHFNIKDGPLSSEEVLKAVHIATTFGLTKSIIFCDFVGEDAISLSNSIKDFSFQFITKYEIYDLLNKKNLIPNESKLKKDTKNKISFKKISLFVFNKKKIKTYLLIGVLMLFSSYIVPYSLYYKVSSILFFAMALLCLIIKVSPAKEEALVKW